MERGNIFRTLAAGRIRFMRPKYGIPQLLFTLIALPAVAADYQVHLVDPPITDHAILPDGPLPPVCRPVEDIELHGCRGQFLPLAFVVSASKPLEKVEVEVDRVRGSGRDWPAGAVDVRVVKDYYRNTVASRWAVMPSLLVRDDSFLAIEPAPTERRPDRLANVARGPLRDADSLQPVDIAMRRQFWVTIQIPEKARAGTYETTVHIAPGNSETTEFDVAIEIHPFDLLPPMIEYSIYYPAYLEAGTPDTSRYKFGDLSAEQMLAEFRNMRDHGLTNPNIYDGPEIMPDGGFEFKKLDRILDLREQAGLRPRVLYMISPHVPRPLRPLTEEEHRQVKTRVAAINAWARGRGYDDVFMAMPDESWGDHLSLERDSMIAIEEAGGSTFVAVMFTTFFERVGDVLTRPVLLSSVLYHLDHQRKAWSAQEGLRKMHELGEAGTFTRQANDPRYREAIDGMHRQGRKIFTYMNPQAGFPVPGLHRRNNGLGMWRVGFDGAMNWAYAHIESKDRADQPMIYGMVYRTEDGVLDGLTWEGFREGVYDMRYLTTLLARLGESAGRFPDEPLVEDTWNWLRQVDAAEGDLDAIRSEMARRIIDLQGLGYRRLSPEEMFADIDLDRVRLTTIPEPWRFKPDQDDEGIEGRWFGESVDISEWEEIRTDVDKGWDSARYGTRDNAGYGWYRTALPLAVEDLAKKHRYLFFGGVDEDCWVYLNGRLIFDHSLETTGLISWEIWRVPFTVPLTGQLRGGDALAVRVKNTDGMGGVWKPVQLIASDRELSHAQILALVKLRKPKATP